MPRSLLLWLLLSGLGLVAYDAGTGGISAAAIPGPRTMVPEGGTGWPTPPAPPPASPEP